MNCKKLYSIFIVLLILTNSIITWAQHSKKTTEESFSKLNRKLSPKEMTEDLQVFYNIRLSVNSGMFRYRSKKEIDSIYNWASEKVKKPMYMLDFYKVILQLTDFEGSLHNHTEPNLEMMEFLNQQKTFFPYHLTYMEGKIIFDGHHKNIPPGARILSINGVEEKDLMQSFYKYFTTDGYNYTYKLSASVEKAFGWRYCLEYGLTDKYEVVFTAPGSEKKEKIILSAVSLKIQEENRKKKYSYPVTSRIDYKSQFPYSFEMIKPNVGLLNLRWFGMATDKHDPAFDVYVSYIDSVFNVLDKKKITNLIIDVRNNPGGSDPNFEQPMMYLTDAKFKENLEAYIIFDPKSIPYEKYFWGVSTIEKMDSLSLAKGREFLSDYFYDFNNGKSYQNNNYNPEYLPKSPTFKGKIYLLINENVASAASHFASLVKAYSKNLTIVGVETSGGYYVHNGHIPMVFELPNSEIKTQFSIVYVVQDAPVKKDQPDGRGIIPDYEVWPKFNDFIQNIDTQLEFVLKQIDTN